MFDFDDFDAQVSAEEIYGPDYDWTDPAPRGIDPDAPPFPGNLDMGRDEARELSDAFWAFFDRVYA